MYFFVGTHNHRGIYPLYIGEYIHYKIRQVWFALQTWRILNQIFGQQMLARLSKVIGVRGGGMGGGGGRILPNRGRIFVVLRALQPIGSSDRKFFSQDFSGKNYNTQIRTRTPLSIVEF